MPLVLLQITRAAVREMLRADALGLVLGVLLLAAGLFSAAFYARSRRREASLFWLGSFALLYGLRLLARSEAFRLLCFDAPGAFWDHAAAVLTYVIPVAGFLLLRSTAPAWRRVATWVAAFLAAFAACAVTSDALLRRPESAKTPNNLIAIALILAALAVLFRPGLAATRELRTLRLGILAVSTAAMLDNLRGLGVVALAGPDVEPVGFAVLIACLGTLAAWRIRGNAERLVAIDRELSIARQIQAAILPRDMPRLAGLTVAARYRPMTAVAGDFYDFLEIDDRRLGVLVADASGHGVPAALIASMVKVAVAAQKDRAEHPAAVLAGMNETLWGRLGGQYVTAAYLFLDRRAGLLRYGAAGHPPMLRAGTRESEVREVEQNGFPLGLMEAARYEELQQPLDGGDRFLLYTDGLVEAANAAGEFFGLERVKAAIVGGAARTPDALADALLEALATWSGLPAADDLTLVLVDCGREGGSNEA